MFELFYLTDFFAIPRTPLYMSQIDASYKQRQFFLRQRDAGLSGFDLRPPEPCLLQPLVPPFEMQVMRSQPRVLCE
jgi:hypothetical protein